MLTNISIERFKSVRRAELELGRVNVFIGGNGAGKSNLLEAIGVVSAALARGVGDGDLARKGVRLTPPELMKSAFKGDLPKTLALAVTMDRDVEYRMHLTGSSEDPLLGFFSESCTYRGERVFGRSHAGAKVLGDAVKAPRDRHRSMWDQVRVGFEFPEDVQSELDALSDFVIYTPQTDFLRGVQVGPIDAPPIGLRGEGLVEAVRGLLLQWGASPGRREWKIKRRALRLASVPGWAGQLVVGRVDDYLISREVQDTGDDMVYFVDKFMHGKRNKLSAYDSSEGTLFLLFAAVVIAHDEAPPVFGFDNVDGALNPRATRRLVEAIINATETSARYGLRCGPRQVFLTSHHPSTLDAFDLFDDAQRVFVVERDENGGTVIERLQPRDGMTREDWDFATKGRRLSQLWMDGDIKGALGAAPDG